MVTLVQASITPRRKTAHPLLANLLKNVSCQIPIELNGP